jgi:hypothetical protein
MTGMVKKNATKRIFLDMIKVMRIIVGDRRHRQDDSLNLHHLNAAAIRVLMTSYLSDEHITCIHQVDEVSNFFHEIILWIFTNICRMVSKPTSRAPSSGGQ